MGSPQDITGMLREIEDAGFEREPDGHVIPYAFNWLLDPGAPDPKRTDSEAQADRVASLFATSVLHLAGELTAARSVMANDREHWSRDQKRIDRLTGELAEARDLVRSHCSRVSIYQAMLVDVLASATPSKRDHPSMSRAWERAQALLDGAAHVVPE